MRYPVMNPAKPGKVLERIASAADKIFILVGGWLHHCLFYTVCALPSTVSLLQLCCNCLPPCR